MTTAKIGKQADSSGNLRYFVYPIETEADFTDLMQFVCQQFECQTASTIEGPGTIVKKLIIEDMPINFVLSDSTGAQFFAEKAEYTDVMEKIAERIEERLREVLDG